MIDKDNSVKEVKQIWCLFSIDNRLECWWFEKPTHNQLKNALETSDDVFVIKLLQGVVFTDFRLQQVQENQIL